MIVNRKVQELEGTDVVPWYNDTGANAVYNQLVFIPTGTNQGKVGIVLGPESASLTSGVASTTIEAGTWGRIVDKGFVELPKAACAMSQGYCAQASTSGTSLTVGGTTAGLYAIGSVIKSATSDLSYVQVDLNEGCWSAFYVW
jgi:predicted RecA/RadA family phage recombinase